jgi:large subunit ribosomal protein L13
LSQKKYYRHSGYPGGLKEITLRDQLQKFPNRVLEKAVRGMLPKNRLGRQMFKKLKVYAGPNHPHQAQQPKPLDL